MSLRYVKLVFCHLASYAGKLHMSAEEIMVDIMDVHADDWVAVTYGNKWFPGIFLKVKSINCSHSFLSITIPTYLVGIDSPQK